MAGPWEKYQSAGASQGPWQKYGDSASQSPFQRSMVQSSPDVINEMHPELEGRFTYKNFATDPEAGFNYLQKENPNLEFKKDSKGEILTKRRDEQKWKKVDPSGFDWRDITDVAWDLPAGLVEGAATAAGGVAGGVAGAPTIIGAAPAALGGAALAGGTTSAALETARQGIGKWLGATEEFDPGQIGISGAFGAASPLLFGTGAAMKGIAGAAKQGLKQAGKEVTEEATIESMKQLAKSQQGLLSRGFGAAKGAIAPRLGEAVSGIDREVLKWAAEPQNLAKIQAAEQSIGSVDVFNDLRDQFLSAAETQKRGVGNELGAELSKISGETVPVDDITKEFSELLSKYQKDADRLGTKASKDNFEYLQKVFEENIPEGLRTPKITRGALGEPITQGTHRSSISAAEAFNIRDALNDVTNIRKATPGVDLSGSGLSKVDSDLQRIARMTVEKLDNRTLDVAEKAGGKVKELRARYKKSMDDAKAVNKLFKDEQSTEKTLGAFVKTKQTSQRKQIQGLSTRLGIPITDTSREAIALQTLSKPIGLPLSSQGVTSTSRTIPLAAAGTLGGYLIGNQIGGGYGGGLTGGAVGGALGSMLGGPAAMRQYLRMNAAAGRGAQGLMNRTAAGQALPQATLNAWQQMMQNRR